MAAWAARYLLFAYGNAHDASCGCSTSGILLHGVCYDFFFVTGQIYVDQAAPKSIRGERPGLHRPRHATASGMLIGSWVSGPVVDRYARQAGEVVTHDWTSIWLWPASMAFVIILLFAFFFDGGKSETKTAA